MKPTSLQELYIEQLNDLYDAEQQIIKALPKMIDAATSEDLKAALTEHLEVTRTQATRLEQIFATIDQKTKREKCKGMQGVLAEGNDLVGETKDADVRDAAIIASAQRVEHYEMAGYGTARTYAMLLGHDLAAQSLQKTLEEEKDADETLTSLAGEINANASQSRSGEAERTPIRSKSKRVA